MEVLFENEEYKISVSSVTALGDCHVTQRKGKTLCIFDMKVVFVVEGSKKSEEGTFSSNVTVPEFVHDQDDDEYVFVVELEQALIRKNLVPSLKKMLQQFQADLIASHEKDVQHSSQ